MFCKETAIVGVVSLILLILIIVTSIYCVHFRSVRAGKINENFRADVSLSTCELQVYDVPVSNHTPGLFPTLIFSVLVNILSYHLFLGPWNLA